MKPFNVRLLSKNGEELETFPLEGITVAEEWDEVPSGNTQVAEYMAAVEADVRERLRERRAAPLWGLTWLRLALGEALLTAPTCTGDVVLEIIVQPLAEGEN